MIASARRHSLPDAAVEEDRPMDGGSDRSSTAAEPQNVQGHSPIDLSRLSLTPAELAAEYWRWIVRSARQSP
jgi:hypothetical protein